MKNILWISFVIFHLISYSQSIDWAKSFGSGTSTNMCVGEGEYFYSCGDIVNFGNASLGENDTTNYPMGSNKYLCKYDYEGNLQWSKLHQSHSVDFVEFDTVSENIYLSGVFTNYNNLSILENTPIIHTATQNVEAYVICYDKNGVFQYVKIFNNGQASYIKKIVFDGHGNWSVIDEVGTGHYLKEYSANGTLLSSVLLYDSPSPYTNVLDFDMTETGEIIVAGTFDSVLNTSTNQYLYNSWYGRTGFISKFDTLYNEIWTITLNDSIQSGIKDIELNDKGEIYCIGSLDKKASINPLGQNLFFNSSIGPTTFILKIPSNGNSIIWEKFIPSTGFIDISDMGFKIDDKGSLYFSAVYSGDISPSNNFMDHIKGSIYPNAKKCIIKFDSLGNYQSNINIDDNHLYSVYYYPNFLVYNDAIFVAGDFIGHVDFDQHSTSYILNNINYESIYLAKYNFNGSNGNTISGIIHKEESLDCNFDNNEQAMNNIIVKMEPYHFYSMTDSSGKYSSYVDSGIVSVSQVTPSSQALIIDQFCPSTPNYIIQFDSVGQDTTGINFANEVTYCPLLTVDIASNRRRRCFKNNTYINYCNIGFADTTGVKVKVRLPQYVEFVSASMVYTIDGDGNYVFDIDTLRQGECGVIQIIDSVQCIENIMGLTQCTKAWITPINSCILSDTVWDESDLSLTAKCVFETNLVQFTIKNNGVSMTDSSEYRIYGNGLLGSSVKFMLSSGDSLVYQVSTYGGVTVRIEVDQVHGHPTENTIYVDIESCLANIDSISYGVVNQLAQYDENVTFETECLPIIDSYDPNDKQVSPQGITTNHFVKPETLLEYVIRFQNTGTDTAYRVVIVDTLDVNLDVSTIQWGVSSHNYTINVTGTGQPVLIFTFDNINLPDSITDNVNSQGFVKFKIACYDSIINGVIINNMANIYFDFNSPIMTNNTWVTISDTNLMGASIDVRNITGVDKSILESNQFKITPNPFNEEFSIKLKPVEEDVSIIVTNVVGKVQNCSYRRNRDLIIVDGRSLSTGIYFIQLIDSFTGEVKGNSKVIKN